MWVTVGSSERVRGVLQQRARVSEAPRPADRSCVLQDSVGESLCPEARVHAREDGDASGQRAGFTTRTNGRKTSGEKFEVRPAR